MSRYLVEAEFFGVLAHRGQGAFHEAPGRFGCDPEVLADFTVGAFAVVYQPEPLLDRFLGSGL